MQIRIHGYLAASDLLEREPGQWDALIVLDRAVKPTEFVAEHARRHCFLTFDDIDRPTEGRQLATAEQLGVGLDFAKHSRQLLVSCHAGQSRSAALAFLIACQNLGVDAAANLLDPRRHIPNSLVVRLGATLLEMPEVQTSFDQWKKQHAAIKLADCYDEIEQEIGRLEASGVVNRIVKRVVA